jgi:hypothetical protein
MVEIKESFNSINWDEHGKAGIVYHKIRAVIDRDDIDVSLIFLCRSKINTHLKQLIILKNYLNVCKLWKFTKNLYKNSSGFQDL